MSMVGQAFLSSLRTGLNRSGNNSLFKMIWPKFTVRHFFKVLLLRTTSTVVPIIANLISKPLLKKLENGLNFPEKR